MDAPDKKPLPPHIQALAVGLRDELFAFVSSLGDAVLADLTVATAVRLELHLLLPGAHDSYDLKWDRELDKLYRRFFRGLEALRNPRRARSTPAASKPGSAPSKPSPGLLAATRLYAASQTGPSFSSTVSPRDPAQKTRPTPEPPQTLASSPTASPLNAPSDPAEDSPDDDASTDSLEPANPTRPNRRPDPARLQQQNRRERRRLARQRSATPRASPA